MRTMSVNNSKTNARAQAGRFSYAYYYFFSHEKENSLAKTER